MRQARYIIYLFIAVLAGSCVSEFIPETEESAEMLVVEGLITDQPGINVVTLSKSQPLASRTKGTPYRGCIVTITDDLGNVSNLREKSAGTYVTDSAHFIGVVGRTYKLTIRTNNVASDDFTYESMPVKMIPVPPVDSIYYEKEQYNDVSGHFREGCQIWFDSHDPDNEWDYRETWMFHLPYVVTNNTCWISSNSTDINIRNTSVLSENRISKYPLNFVSPESDRLSKKYSLLLNQYSLSEDEFNYWEKLKKVTEEVGSLYDVTPSFIPGNVVCLEDNSQTVLGYFSVSAKKSKRLFVSSHFTGLVNLYNTCASDTVNDLTNVSDLNNKVWVIETNLLLQPPIYVLTRTKGCADCTVRGTNIKPSWWDDSK
jgi:Domain of unknown function (DUF4249)